MFYQNGIERMFYSTDFFYLTSSFYCILNYTGNSILFLLAQSLQLTIAYVSGRRGFVAEKIIRGYLQGIAKAITMSLLGSITPFSYLDRVCLVIMLPIISHSCCIDNPRINRALCSLPAKLFFKSFAFWRLILLFAIFLSFMI